MSREEVRSALGAFAIFALSPPGWIPAWGTLIFTLIIGWDIQAAALHSEIEIARIQLSLEVYKVTKDLQVASLAVWLGYRGIGGIIEAFRAVFELRKEKEKNKGAGGAEEAPCSTS